MNGTMKCYFNNGRVYTHDSVVGIMFVNGQLVVNVIDEDGQIQALKYTQKSLKDNSVLTIY